MKILVVLTSHDRLGDTGEKTGFWLEELAAPYYVFKDAGADVTLASPAGGQPPLDPKSDDESAQTAATERFRQDDEANKQLAATLALSQVDAADFDAVFYPGGHGPLWDLATDTTSINLLEAFARADKPLALVCHAPGALVKVRDADGQPLVAGRRVTGFSNSEEDAVGLTEVVPFLIEDEFKRLGGLYEKGPDWEPLAVTDGYLVTGQNPASSEATASALLKLL
ncbi:type 1 glutamine amidotransferase domain-containing protein [Aliidiomarina sedimenti]|uniref:Type 1 glutamine amidotransferase domain-containing protein n=1 Tax=Aliidiomarina sedimenti TaxID=1933879 RepID=A0ABY0C0M5_9GAMM|nr:type 1 glutamine amidotransferase domain-containing protein [Aliidiomarina sedimenti]RUO30904.1 type 1 glutamine amidotransferase domain-containing protein [Aliidiomarina sedimenti]